MASKNRLPSNKTVGRDQSDVVACYPSSDAYRTRARPELPALPVPAQPSTPCGPIN